MDNAAREQAFICRQLDRAARHFPFRRIVYAVAGQEREEGSLIQSWPRLGLILKGTREVTLPGRNGVEPCRLTAGDAYYALPNAWEAYSWNTSLELLCVVPRLSYVRVSHYDQPRADQAPPVPRFHHTGRPYGDAMRFTTEALNSLPWTEHRAAGPDLARALIRLAREECAAAPPPAAGKAGGKGRITFDRVRSWLENCFQDDIGRQEAAAQFSLTPTYLSRLFHVMTGMGFHHYLTKLRLDHARQLLRETELSVKQIAGQSGFPNAVHFVRRFRERYGIPPGRYREAGAAE